MTSACISPLVVGTNVGVALCETASPAIALAQPSGLSGKRAFRLAGGRRSIKPILLAKSADDPLRIFPGAFRLFHPFGVVALRVVIRERGIDHRQLVAPDTPINQLLDTGGGVKPPFTADLLQRDRERPVIRAY